MVVRNRQGIEPTEYGRALLDCGVAVPDSDVAAAFVSFTHLARMHVDGLAGPGEILPVQITAATSQTLSGEMSLLARAS